VLDVDSATAVGLPIDKLALLVLADLVATNAWNERNYLIEIQHEYGRSPSVKAVAEALAWLRAHTLIARNPDQDSEGSIFVTRSGHQVLNEGPTVLFATERLQTGSHPLIERIARSQFLLGN
jgi:hypothetical protein